jgi:hypothetical protein
VIKRKFSLIKKENNMEAEVIVWLIGIGIGIYVLINFWKYILGFVIIVGGIFIFFKFDLFKYILQGLELIANMFKKIFYFFRNLLLR